MVWCVLQGNALRKTSVPANVRMDAMRRQHEETRAEMEAQARRCVSGATLQALGCKSILLAVQGLQRCFSLAWFLDDL